MSQHNNKIEKDSSESELQVPAFLNEALFAKILKTKHDADVKITELIITPGTTKADNYASVVFRAKVTYNVGDEEVKSQSMIIKTSAVDESERKDLFDNYDLFETEIRMYSQAFPKMEAILRKHGDKTKLCADVLYFSTKPQKCIILEDLSVKGFTTVTGRWCTIEEVKAALSKVAKMHATSYKLAQEGDDCIRSFCGGSCSQDAMIKQPFVAQATALFKKILAEHDDLEQYIVHIEAIEDNFGKDVVESFQAYEKGKHDGIFVLNHGDYHMKNVLVKLNGNAFEDLMLIDFQISVFGSMAIDLLYANVMLFSPEMREKHRDELFYYYFKSFQDTLRLIDYKGNIPKIIDFQKELLNYGHWELFLFISFLMFSHVFTYADGDLARAVEDESYRRSVFESPAVLAEIRRFLPVFLHKGFFEKK